MHDDPWAATARDDLSLFGTSRLPVGASVGRVSHLVLLDGRLVDAWTESPDDGPYAALARELDAERRPHVVQAPPPPPRHEQVLAWLDGIVGGRACLLALAPDPVVPPLREALDPVGDEPWLVVDELVADVCDALLTPDLEAPLRRCLLLLHERAPWLPERTAPERIGAGIVWLVGKANAAIGPAGPTSQTVVASHLGVSSSLGSHGAVVSGHVRRLGWASPRPRQGGHPDLHPVGRPELLSATVVTDLVRMRDEALAERAAAGVS